jgi:hypothetical protein
MTAFPPCPGTGRACAASVIGIEGHLTHAEATTANGPPGLRITGLPGTAVREARDRVYAAILNSGQELPARTIAVTLRPASLPRHGTGFDLAIAVAALTAAGVVPLAVLDGCVFTAELGLDGSLRPVRGVMPALVAAARAGCTRAVVAVENAAEAVMVAGLAVVPCASLRTVLAWLRGQPFPPQPDIPAADTTAAAADVLAVAAAAGLAVPPHVRQALEASATGGHHLCLTGSHGSRIPALAASLAALMPPLGPEQMMEATAIHSAAGLLRAGHALITRPPFRAPHHTATRTTPLPAPRSSAAAPRPSGPAKPPWLTAASCSSTTPPSSPATSSRRCASRCRTARSRSPASARRSGSRQSSPSSPAWPRAHAAAVLSVLAARCKHAATAPGWPPNSAVTWRSSSMPPLPVPVRPAPGNLTITRTPPPRSASPPPATAPATGSGTHPGRSTAISPPPSCAAPTRR